MCVFAVILVILLESFRRHQWSSARESTITVMLLFENIEVIVCFIGIMAALVNDDEERTRDFVSIGALHVSLYVELLLGWNFESSEVRKLREFRMQSYTATL